jgi:alpha-glucosidase (family GH31 glycosyl hydrolase)
MEEPETEVDKKRNRNKCGWIIAIIAIVVIVLLGVVLFVTESHHLKKGLGRYNVRNVTETPHMFDALLFIKDKAKNAKKLPIQESANNKEFDTIQF